MELMKPIFVIVEVVVVKRRAADMLVCADMLVFWQPEAPRLRGDITHTRKYMQAEQAE